MRLFVVILTLLTIIFVSFAQRIYGITAAEYLTHKTVCNLTIQHTVASVMGVVPQQVAGIVIVEEMDEPVKASELRSAAHTSAARTVSSCSLSYKVTADEPYVLFEVLKERLMDAVATGQMEKSLSHYAAVFNVSQLANSTFGIPLVTNAATERPAQKRLTGPQIAGLVLGCFLFFALLATFVLFLQQQKQHRTLTEAVDMFEALPGGDIDIA